MSITAPFNFVPFNGKIFYPDWANAISQDIPFADGESGTITLNIEACSPIFVRNGSLSEDNKEERFSQWNDKYFLPGSSVKGMIRSVLEILSFGKLGIYDDNRYAVRDLSSADNFYMKKMKNISCGFLTRTAEGYKIIDCGKPGRISHRDIDKEFKTEMFAHFRGQKTAIPDIYDEADDRFKSAKYKYDLFPNIGRKKFTFKAVPKKETANKYDNRLFYTFSESENEGEIIFTGQPNTTKLHEFVFFQKSNASRLNVDAKVFKDFEFAYFDHDDKKQSEDWKHWKVELAKDPTKNDIKIPIFFQLTADKKSVAHFGLSYLYKLPYEYSVAEAAANTQKDTKANALDLAECIFGSIEDDNKDGTMLKGRVHFGHAYATVAEEADRVISAVLNSPKASYYPIYIRQNISDRAEIRGNYKTFMDKDVQISGRKRYPVQNGNVQENPAPLINGKRNSKVETQFVPLKKGAIFQCQIAYHNLRKAELGALLSAISFHNTKGCFHSIGMAKPLGYGKIKVGIANIQPTHQKAQAYLFENALSAFEYIMGQELGGAMKWLRSEQIEELFTMATPSAQTQNKLRYMPLADFSKMKKEKKALQIYSQLSGNKIFPISQTTGIIPVLNTQTIDVVTSTAVSQGNVAIKIADLKQQLKAKLKALSSPKQDNTQVSNNAVSSSTNNTQAAAPTQIVPQFLQKNSLNPKKRYNMEAIVTKAGTPNLINIYVKEGIVPQNIKLDIYKSLIEVGKVIIVSVSVNAKEQVIQASFNGFKL